MRSRNILKVGGWSFQPESVLKTYIEQKKFQQSVKYPIDAKATWLLH